MELQDKKRKIFLWKCVIFIGWLNAASAGSNAVPASATNAGRKRFPLPLPMRIFRGGMGDLPVLAIVLRPQGGL